LPSLSAEEWNWVVLLMCTPFDRPVPFLRLNTGCNFLLFPFLIETTCHLVVRVPSNRTEIYCASCEVRTDFICYVEESRPPVWSSGQSSLLQSEDVLCFLSGTNWIYICYVEESRPPLWSSGQSSWLQIQRSGLDSRRYHIFWEVLDLKLDPLSLVSTTEEIIERRSSGSGLESRECGPRDPSRWPRAPSIRKILH
jgi:hypothetical protein